MELLRRALLVGCILPGLWLMRLAPLDPLLSVIPIDFMAVQKRQAAAVPDSRKTEAQRRSAVLPFPVWLGEYLKSNIFSGVGPEWDRLLRQIDQIERDPQSPTELAWRTSSVVQMEEGPARLVFFRLDEEPISAVLDKLAAGGGTTYVSFSRPGGDLHYRVDRRTWTRRDFRPGAGFTGSPAPPAALLYPFRALGLGSIAVGIVLFLLLPGAGRPAAEHRLRLAEPAALVVGLLFFTVPLIATGGSVQALTRGLELTLPCWLAAAVGVHVFAGPSRNAPDSLVAAAPDSATRRTGTAGHSRGELFLREGLAFLFLAIGPLLFLIVASMILWNR